ncbi:hypothetical protein THTE_2434 [Thermogutta terrifontis]|uniref:Uncharacterized protein n=1 Tax=Thermogutta terrifontis TaxID=1331910 RepID=A0A286RGG3_9BACT|nr:hypothetical protein THTE_2434 [Thermogutta terrifontis]
MLIFLHEPMTGELNGMTSADHRVAHHAYWRTSTLAPSWRIEQLGGAA